MIWQIKGQTLKFPRPLVMGIVNVTPDSFSDGGKFFDHSHAIEHGLKLIAEGADILDIGGESTRPGATPVAEADELERVLPVISALAPKVIVSVDTMKANVARAAIDAGAVIVNDVAGLRDPAMARVCRDSGVGVIVMHMQGTPQTMQANPTYTDVVSDTVNELRHRIHQLTDMGLDPNAIGVDPGIGFGKTFDQTLSQLRRLREYTQLGKPICLGVSRKGFLGQVTGRDRAGRLAGTVAVNSFGMALGAAQIIRVHDVAEHTDAARLAGAIFPS